MARRVESCASWMRLVRAPMQGFDLAEERFRLIFSAFRSFQHLLTVEDQLYVLRSNTSAIPQTASTTETNPFAVKKAALIRERSPGFTIACW